MSTSTRRPRGKAAATPRSFRGVAADERRFARRAQLLKAGIRAFGGKGYHAVTVRQICTGAKLTERYFYESFAGLEDLFVAVYREVSEELMRITLAALRQTPREALALAEAGLRAYLEFVRDDVRRARILLIDSISISHDVQRVSAAVASDYASLVRGFTVQLFPDAAAQGLQVDLIAAGLIGANVHIATHWLREGFRTPLEDVLASNLLFFRTALPVSPVVVTEPRPPRRRRT